MPLWSAESLAFDQQVYTEAVEVMARARSMSEQGKKEEAFRLLEEHFQPNVLVFLGSHSAGFSRLPDFKFLFPDPAELLVEGDRQPFTTGSMEVFTVLGNQNLDTYTVSCTGTTFMLALLTIDVTDYMKLIQSADWVPMVRMGVRFYNWMLGKLHHPRGTFLAVDELVQFTLHADPGTPYGRMRQLVTIVGGMAFGGRLVNPRAVDFIEGKEKPSLVSKVREMVRLGQERPCTGAFTIGVMTFGLYCYKDRFAIINTHDDSSLAPPRHSSIYWMDSADAAYEMFHFCSRRMNSPNGFYSMCILQANPSAPFPGAADAEAHELK